MNAHSLPLFAHTLKILQAFFRGSFFRGLVRMMAYSSCASISLASGLPDENPLLIYLRLASAVEHLTRPKPVLVNFRGERYIDRVNHADPAMLEEVLKENGCTQADVENWRTYYDSQNPPADAS